MSEIKNKILIVESSNYSYTNLKEKLLNKDTISWDFAKTGEEALEYCKNIDDGYDAIILDENLKNLNSYKVLDQLKHEYPTTRVILSIRNSDTRLKALKHGACRYVINPSEEELEIHIDRIIEIRNLERMFFGEGKFIEATRKIAQKVGVTPKKQLLKEIAKAGLKLLDAAVCIVWEQETNSRILKISEWEGEISKEYINDTKLDCESDVIKMYLNINKKNQLQSKILKNRSVTLIKMKPKDKTGLLY